MSASPQALEIVEQLLQAHPAGISSVIVHYHSRTAVEYGADVAIALADSWLDIEQWTLTGP
jgi:hypothetical protein